MAAQHLARYPEADARALELNNRVRHAATSVKAAFSRYLTTLGVNSSARFGVLQRLHLAEAGWLTQLELARRLSVTGGAITYLIDSLEDEGLVTRSAHPVDRRMTCVRLTDKGRELCSRIVPESVQFSQLLCREFSDEEIVQFNDLLRRLHGQADRLFTLDQ